MRAKQNYIARIAIISPKESFVKVHFWDVADNRATIKSSKPRKTRFERRKTNYVKIGETKIGKYTCKSGPRIRHGIVDILGMECSNLTYRSDLKSHGSK
jgi:hypothetical protein